MKAMKKILAVLMVVAMIAVILPAAFAEDPTITVPTGRQYDIFQILKGDLADGKLSNVVWGANAKAPTPPEGETPIVVVANEPVAEAVLTAISAITGTDAEKAAKIAEYVDLDSAAFASVSKDDETRSVTVPSGYYMVVDKGPINDNEAYSLYVVKVVGSVTIAPKVGTTTSQKKVDDKNDSNTSEDSTVWQDSADYDIGDDVPFQLSATITPKYADFRNGYKLTFHDYESAGLTFNKDSVVVKVDGEAITTGYTVVTPGAEADADTCCTFEVRFADLKSITNNDGPMVRAGSVITVEYTSKLNTNAVIGSEGNPNTSHITYSANPNVDTPDEEGKTPDDTVIVFTYKVVANKVDENGAALQGAGFTLYKKNAAGNYVAVGNELVGGTMTTFEWKGIDDGDYKISETTTPAGYNTIADIEFTVTAGHDILADNPALTSLSGQTFTGAVDTGAVTSNIENRSGNTLPSTGGIGTTMFYVFGSILVIGAAVLLISKKRMGAAE